MSTDVELVASSGLNSCNPEAVDEGKIDLVVERLPSLEDIQRLSDVFALLGDLNRLRMLTSLLAGGELRVSDLAAVTGTSESAVSHALRLLRAHRVVKCRRSGRMSYYSLSDDHVRLVLALGLEHLRHDE